MGERFVAWPDRHALGADQLRDRLSRFVLSSHLNRHNVPDLEWLNYLWHCAERAGPTGRLWECCRGVIPMPESSDLSLMTDSVGKGRFSRSCHRSKLIGSGITGRGV